MNTEHRNTVAQLVKNPANAGDARETRSLGREDPLKEEMATHLSILAWKIPWTEEPGGLQSMGSSMRRLSTHTIKILIWQIALLLA